MSSGKLGDDYSDTVFVSVTPVNRDTVRDYTNTTRAVVHTVRVTESGTKFRTRNS